MNKSLILTCVFVLFSLTQLFAQSASISNADWQLIETEKKEFSILFPKGYLVNIQSDAGTERTSVYGFQNGVSLELKIRKQINARDNLARINVEQVKKPVVFDFKVNDFYGKSVIYTQDGYENKIYLASKNAYYVIGIVAASKEKAEVTQILQSIKLNGEALFNSETKTDTVETVSIKTLKTSPQVKEALDRKSQKTARKITFEPLAAFQETAPDYSLRPAISLTDYYPDPRAFLNGVSGNNGGEIKIRVNLLASGQVGDITIYSDIDKRVLRSYADSLGKLKFIPAQKPDGSFTDSTQTFWSFFAVTVTTGIITVQ